MNAQYPDLLPPYLELLPAVDVRDGQAVRLVQGELSRETVYGDPLEVALDFQKSGAEWLHSGARSRRWSTRTLSAGTSAAQLLVRLRHS